MRLSRLFAEDLALEGEGMFKGLSKYVSQAFGRAKREPNPKALRVKKIVREVFQEVWGDYYNDPKALARIESYKNSILQHMPALLGIEDNEQLRHEVEMLFRSRAERVPYSINKVIDRT